MAHLYSHFSIKEAAKLNSWQKYLWSNTLAVNVQENANSVQPLNLPPQAKNMQKASSRIQWSFTFITGFSCPGFNFSITKNSQWTKIVDVTEVKQLRGKWTVA